MISLKNQISKLPNTPGIYQFLDKEQKIIYVGKSISIRKRVRSYFTRKSLGMKTDRLVRSVASVTYIKVFSEFEALLLESALIKKYKPFFNVTSKDDKSPIYIKITNDKIPLVLTTRKVIQKKGQFLKGPFPSAKTTREILKTVRRIFPYCTHRRVKRACLYVHLGLCSYPYGSKQAEIEYAVTVKRIKKLLSAKSRSLERDLLTEMRRLAQKQEFEKALALKKQITSLESLRTSFHTAREYVERPTLVDDLTLVRLVDLKNTLNLKKLPKRIECYDISNIGGKLATGSMVVFTNGNPDKSQYRLFKIKFSNGANDYEMLKEVLARRVKNDWQKPDLIIIDGGKGQLNAALSILAKYKYDTIVVSLAKRLEGIYVPGKILPLLLPKESPARQLAQALRDEAHRFAVTYHRKIRSKSFLARKA